MGKSAYTWVYTTYFFVFINYILTIIENYWILMCIFDISEHLEIQTMLQTIDDNKNMTHNNIIINENWVLVLKKLSRRKNIKHLDNSKIEAYGFLSMIIPKTVREYMMYNM